MKCFRNPRARVFAALAALHLAAAAADDDRIAGRWVTFDGGTHAKRSVVEIVLQGGKATGRIVEFHAAAGEDPDPVCESCPGADRGRKIRGLTILHLERAPGTAQFQGTVLDPEEGRVYQCVATLQDGGRRLELRGYVLLRIFGRSETWVRAE